VLVALGILAGGTARADAPVEKPPVVEEAVDGLFVTVRNPITTTVVNRVRAVTNRFLDRPDHRGLKIVYDFDPDGNASSTADYGTCRDLAVYLLDLQDITTVAFVHNEVTGHTVLPVLACKEIAMSAKAKLGDAMRGQTKPLEADQLLFYKTIAERRRRPPAAVMKMIDRNVALRDPGEFTELFDQAQAEKVGLCEVRLETRNEVKDAYRLPTTSLREDPLQGRSPDAWRIVVSGPVTRALKETIIRRTQRAIAHGANLIILQLDCHGGETDVARDLADFLRTRKDDKDEEPVMTVAYVSKSAGETATFLALGCTEIVMDQQAHLGGFDRVVQERPDYAEAIGRSLADLAEKQGYPPVLARAMLEPNLAVRQVLEKKGRLTERRFVDEKEFEEDQKSDHKWQGGELIKPRGDLLRLDSRRARDLDIAKYVFTGKSHELMPWLRDRYGLDQVRDAGPDWLDELADFLCKPIVSVFLVMIGITGLILELKIPGIGLPGVVAALCFVLYFWAHHDQLRGHLTMLAILLFMLGLILIALEIFVVPGLGVVGISGIILVIVSLGLVTLVKKPETTQEWMEFGTTLTTLGLGLAASVAAAFILAWYLPHIPYANRLVLVPPTETEEGFDEPGPTPQASALLGAVGEAATSLRPAGKARFGDDYVDVVAEGSYVAPGARVQVIEIEGNRIVVKEV
jgi:membrane-bound ClpP family serine protease